MIQQIISKSYKKVKKIPLNRDSKFIFFSDCHRGNNSYADDFAHNSTIYFHALRNYYEQNYIYIELGDGIELWENRNFGEIFNAHKNVFFYCMIFLKKIVCTCYGGITT